MKSCELVGGDPESAVPFAAAMEVLHNFTLIHDDIMDNDSLRRGAPTVHALWGEAMAIASGDLLFAKVYQAMVEPAVRGTLPFDKVVDCVKRVTEATIDICEGQALDLSYPNAREVATEDYIFMVGGKTSALFRACAEVGAIMGGGNPDEVARLGAFAWNAGIAFQIVDDVLGVTSEEETLGKPVWSDLREGKVLGVNDAAASDIATAIEALRSTGGIDHAKSRAREYTDNARANIATFPESQAKRDLLELVEFFTERAY